MAEDTGIPFNPLDPLGPDVGKVDLPTIDPVGLTPFEGDNINVPTLENYKNVYDIPAVNLLPPQSRFVNQAPNVRQLATGTPPGKTPSTAQSSASDRAMAWMAKWKGQNATRNAQPKDSFGRIYSYKDAPNGDAFMERYQAFGQEKFDEIGFSPIRNNEALYNDNTTWWQRHSRMMTNSFWPLFFRGFVSGPKSLAKAMTGDFSADPEEADFYERAAAIGQDTTGGFGSFFNNTAMNFGYTAGIITEAIAEEAVAVFLAPETGGTSVVAATANNMRKLGTLGKTLSMSRKLPNFASKGATFNRANRAQAAARTSTAYGKVLNNSIKGVGGTISGSRNFWNAVRTNNFVKFLNPLENTTEALVGIGKNLDNLTGLARSYQAVNKTAGGLYRDMRALNMALSEARLEGGLVQNSTYEKLYNDYYMQNGETPDDNMQRAMMQQAIDAGKETLMWNSALVYGTNKLVFPNIMGPKGGIKNFLKSKTDDILNLDSKVGKMVIRKNKDVAKKGGLKNKYKGEFVEYSFKETLKAFAKDPIRKSAKGALMYLKGNIAEGLQENVQETLSMGLENYYVNKFESSALRAHLFNRAATEYSKDKSEYISEGWKKYNPFTSEGFEIFASGALMGLFASPINQSVEWASIAYNKNFNKEQYNKYIEAKSNYAKGVAATMNRMYSDPKSFFESKLWNYATQDQIFSTKKFGSRKMALDASDEAIVETVSAFLETGNYDMFKHYIGEYNNMTAEEIEEDLGLEKGTGQKYKDRVNKVLDKANQIEETYNDLNQRYPSPINLEDYKKGTDEYKRAAIFNSAWNLAKKNAVFLNSSYKDSLERMSAIVNAVAADPSLSKTLSARDMEMLTNVSKMKSERDMLKAEIDSVKGSGTASRFDITGAGKKQKKLDALDEFIKAYDYFQNYEVFDIEEQLDYLEAEGKLKDIKDNDGNALSEKDAREEAKKFLLAKLKVEAKSEEATLQAKTNLETAYKNFLRASANVNDGTYFEEGADKAFELLLDHYKLGRESNIMAEYINLLHNPKEFAEHVERNYEWMSRLYENRQDHYDQLVNKQLAHIELNAILNALADRNVFISEEDAINFLRNPRMIPEEFFDNTRKAVIREGHPEYEELRTLFVIASATAIKGVADPTNEDLERNLDFLDEEMQKEIDALPQVEVKRGIKSLDTMGDPFVGIQAVFDQLGNEQYIEVSYLDTAGKEQKQIFYKKDNQLYYDNDKGNKVELDTITTQFIDGDIYSLKLEPKDQEAVKEIKERYAQRRIDYINKMSEKVASTAAQEAENRFVPFTSATPYEDMDVELRELLAGAYNEYLDNNPELMEKVVDLDDYAYAEERDSFIRTNRVAKDIIDRYNKKKLAEQATAPTGEIEAPVIEINGQMIDFAALTDAQIRSKIKSLTKTADKLSEDIEALPEDKRTKTDIERLAKMRFNINLAEKYLANRVKNNRSAKMETIKDIINREILRFQDGITKTSNNAKYVIDNDLYTRVTTAIEALKKDAYSYKNITIVIAEFNKTIGQGKSVDDFIAALKTRIPIGIDGMSKYVYKVLARNLKEVLEPEGSITENEIQNQLELDGVIPKYGEHRSAIPTLTETLYDKDGKKIGQKEYVGEKEVNDAIARNVTGTRGNKPSATRTRTKAIKIGNKNYKADVELYSDGTAIYTISEVNAGGIAIKTLSQSEFNKTLNDSGTEKAKKLSGDDLINYLKEQISELTYEESRIGGNYLDAEIRRFLEEGEAQFDESKIDKAAFDAIFGPNSVLAKLKTRQDNGEIKIYANNIKLFDKDSKIAGEIDLLIVDREGNVSIVDIKSGNKDKWSGFHDAANPYSKKETYLLQQTAYANMFYNMTGIMPKVYLLPIEIESDPDVDLDEKTGLPIGGKILTAKYATSPVQLGENLIVLDPNTAYGDQTIQEKVDGLIPRKEFIPAEPATTPLEEVSDEEYKDFVDNRNVSQSRLDDIAYKISRGTQLSDRELAISQEFVADINFKLIQLAQQEQENQVGDDAESATGQAVQDEVSKALTESEKQTRQRNIDILNRRISILESRALEADKSLGELQDTLGFLQNMLDSSVEIAGLEFESLMNSANSLYELANKLKSAKQVKRGEKIKARASQYEKETKETARKITFKEAQFILNTVRKVQDEIRQLEEIKKDLTNQINYYNNLKTDPSMRLINKSEINKKIVKVKRKISTIERLINILRNAIRKSLEYLQEYLKIFSKYNTKLERFRKDTGFQELSADEIRALIDSLDPNDMSTLDRYPQLKKQFDSLVDKVNKSMDDVDFTDEVIQIEKDRLEELVVAHRKYNDQLRYLQELLEPVAADAFYEDVLSDKNAPEAPKPKTGGTPAQQRIQTRIEETNKEIQDAKDDMGDTVGSFSLSDIEETPSPQPTVKTEGFKTLSDMVEAANDITELNNIYNVITDYTLTVDELDQLSDLIDQRTEALQTNTATITYNENNISKGDRFIVKNAIFINKEIFAEPGNSLFIESVNENGVTVYKVLGGETESLNFEELTNNTTLDNMSNIPQVEPVVLSTEDKNVIKSSLDAANAITTEDLDAVKASIKNKSMDDLENDLLETNVCE
jgi:hypothetical protein